MQRVGTPGKVVKKRCPNFSRRKNQRQQQKARKSESDLKATITMLLIRQQRRSLKLQSAQALRFQVLFRFPLRRKLLLSFVQFIRTRTAVNSLSRERTKGLSTF